MVDAEDGHVGGILHLRRDIQDLLGAERHPLVPQPTLVGGHQYRAVGQYGDGDVVVARTGELETIAVGVEEHIVEVGHHHVDAVLQERDVAQGRDQTGRAVVSPLHHERVRPSGRAARRLHVDRLDPPVVIPRR